MSAVYIIVVEVHVPMYVPVNVCYIVGKLQLQFDTSLFFFLFLFFILSLTIDVLPHSVLLLMCDCVHCLQVFDIVLNKRHRVVSNLDIFAKVGKAIAHDEITRFTIENGQLLVGDQVSDFDGTLTVEFSKVCC